MRMMMRMSCETTIEKFWFWLAWLVPRKLAYFCTIRLGAHATTGQYSNTVVPEVTYMDVLKAWEA